MKRFIIGCFDQPKLNIMLWKADSPLKHNTLIKPHQSYFQCGILKLISASMKMMPIHDQSIESGKQLII